MCLVAPGPPKKEKKQKARGAGPCSLEGLGEVPAGELRQALHVDPPLEVLQKRQGRGRVGADLQKFWWLFFLKGRQEATGQNPKPGFWPPVPGFWPPVNLRFNPTTKIGKPKMGGGFTYPKMVPLVLTHSQKDNRKIRPWGQKVSLTHTLVGPNLEFRDLHFHATNPTLFSWGRGGCLSAKYNPDRKKPFRH